MRLPLVMITFGATLLFGCSAIRTGDFQKLDTRPKMKMVATGLIGDCPKESSECEIYLTIIDNPNTNPQEGGAGRCEVAVPVSEIHLHSNNQNKQLVRWRILNGNEFGFLSSGPNVGIVISPNRDNSGHDPAFENNAFTVTGRDDQYQWQSTGKQSQTVQNGYVAYVYRKSGNLPCGTKDPLIANL